ncbi:unnamed protein product [Orchesella dallaii]|uniref:Amine oxidase n=1 Tax=Orchesella dallaii TaxID=48710 RepID=A0ABP1PT21_9HEXA
MTKGAQIIFRFKMNFTIKLAIHILFGGFLFINVSADDRFIFESSKHPLDPLTAGEVHTSSLIIRQHNNSATWLFNRISLHEPEKSTLIQFYLRNEAPKDIPRKSFSVILNRQTLSAVEVIVNLKEKQVESWTDLPGILQPATPRGDRNFAENLVKDDTDVQERCRQLGWSNMSLVAADIWPVGYIGDRPDLNPSNRLVQSFFYGKISLQDNEYAHPFDFVAIVDLKQQKVVSIEDLPTRDDDHECNVPNTVPRQVANFDPSLLGGKDFLRSDLKPVELTQPKGASFTVKRYLVQWQKFQFRVGFNEREGLIIHQVGYFDNDVGQSSNRRFRPLFYRLSLSETFIPYGDSRPPFHRKGAFDMGELDIGISANELNEYEHCRGQKVKFLDATINDEHGEPLRLKRAICIYEEDTGILWKHTDYRTGKSALARSQRLNVAFLATIGNYDYLFTWHFYQDATIDYEVRLTGIVSTNLVAEGSTTAGHGSIVAPQVNAQYHQHVFAMRIDPEIDGNLNSVASLDVLPSPPEDSPYGQGFTTKLTTFRTANESKTYGSHTTSRSWLMMSGNETQNLYIGCPTAYKLVPKHFARFLVQKDSPLYPKSEFSEYDVWVTPYIDGQLYAGGRYLNNSGLPQWTQEAGQRNIEGTDVVLWHVFRVDHVPRAEDYPVMPAESAGFTLKPYNFFRENPALDVRGPTS